MTKDQLISELNQSTYVMLKPGVAGVGVIAIIIPGFPRIKEWAYAGLFFDLIAATYSIIAATGFQPSVFGMALPMVLGTLSYYFYHKKLNA